MTRLYSIGDIVYVKPFKRDGTIVELLKEDQYKVTLGNLVVTVSENDVTKKKGKDISPQKNAQSKGAQDYIKNSSTSQESEILDLHGYTVSEGIAQLENKINRSIVTGVYRIKLVHGLGSGKLKEGLHQYLQASTLVSAFRLDDFNPGVTWVYL